LNAKSFLRKLFERRDLKAFVKSVATYTEGFQWIFPYEIKGKLIFGGLG
jgi:hypothetical protein